MLINNRSSAWSISMLLGLFSRPASFRFYYLNDLPLYLCAHTSMHTVVEAVAVVAVGGIRETSQAATSS
jgi:hypothetical protein